MDNELLKRKIHNFYILLMLFCFILLTTCNQAQLSPTSQGGEEMKSILLKSTAFNQGETIPTRYTCDGEDVSPPLEWAEIPSGTKSLVLIMDDPDAPRGTWVHWVLYNIPLEQKGLPEGISGLGEGGFNDFGNYKYGGPCPPKGKAHRYIFKIYAIDSVLSLSKNDASKQNVEKAMQGHILAAGELIGLFSR